MVTRLAVGIIDAPTAVKASARSLEVIAYDCL